MKHEVIITDFEIDLSLERSRKTDNSTPVISIHGELPSLKLNISAFTYKMLMALSELHPK